MSETFMTFGRARKAVADMSKNEQLEAMRIAAAAVDDAKEELAPFEPMIAADVYPETLEMGLAILDRIVAFEQANDRLLRLCEAVTAKGKH
jgi:hypothetical protein